MNNKENSIKCKNTNWLKSINKIATLTWSQRKQEKRLNRGLIMGLKKWCKNREGEHLLIEKFETIDKWIKFEEERCYINMFW